MSEAVNEVSQFQMIRSYYERRGISSNIERNEYRLSKYNETGEQRYLVSIGEDLLVQFIVNFHKQSMIYCFSELFVHLDFDLKIYFISRMFKCPAFQDIGIFLTRFFVFKLLDDTTEFAEECLLESGHLTHMFGGMTLSERRTIGSTMSRLILLARMPIQVETIKKMKEILEEVSSQRGGEIETLHRILERKDLIKDLQQLEEKRMQQIADANAKALRKFYSSEKEIALG